MMKVKILFCLIISLFVFGLVSCNDSENGDEKVSITEFNVNTTDTMVDIGTVYTLKNVSARDNNGGYYIATVKVTDPNGEEVELKKLSFTCSQFGEYIVTYTVTYNETETISRSYKIEVTDVSEPQVETELYEHNISTIGKTVNLDQFIVTDNSGEDITHTTKVYFNGVLDESSIDNNVLTLTKEGCYTIEIVAKDSNDNTMIKEFNVYTLMDFEYGYYFINPSYSTEITSKQAYDGNCSYSIGAFDNHATYFNDYSLLGCIKVLDRSTQYVSFWIKFQNSEYVDILKAQYHATTIYDEYGSELPKYNETGYELLGNRWYKVVIDMNDVVNLGEVVDMNDVVANPISLDLIPFYWGVWDSVNNTNASKSQKVFIDNVFLTNDPTSGFKKPVDNGYEYPENCIADFESPEQITALAASWNTTLVLSSEYTSSGDYSLKFTPYAQWSHFGLKGIFGIDELNFYNGISMKVYVDDNEKYDSETYVGIDLRYTLDGVNYEVISSSTIDLAGEWKELNFTLGAYSQYSLSSKNFDICIYKVSNGAPVDTGEYSNFSVYLDDIYAIN